MKDLKKSEVYILDYREIDDLIDEIVGIPSRPGYDWKMWEFVSSQQMRNDSCLMIDLNSDDFDEFVFVEIMEWCTKMHEANAFLKEHSAELEAYKNFKHGDGTINEEYFLLSNKMDELMNSLKAMGVEDRPEDYMGINLLHALQYAEIIPAGTYVIEVSW